LHHRPQLPVHRFSGITARRYKIRCVIAYWGGSKSLPARLLRLRGKGKRSNVSRLTVRGAHKEEDFWRIRTFLRDVFLLNNRRLRSWHVVRLDYWRWHFVANCELSPPVPQVTYIWETNDRRIAAVLNPESNGEAFMQVHPHFRAPELEEEMLAFAETHLSVRKADGTRTLYAFADDDDAQRRRLLENRGYVKRGRPENQWRRELDVLIPSAPPIPGYVIRSMGDVDEHPTRSWASWKAFHPDEPDEHYEGSDWYLNIQYAPLYRRDLDIVAVTPGGEIAAFATIWFDDATRSGVFVLVGAMPAHQRRGLSTAVMTEGLHRLQRMGATRAFVSGYSAQANALYATVMSQKDVQEPWVKAW
jgi:mycothiol synthase